MPGVPFTEQNKNSKNQSPFPCSSSVLLLPLFSSQRNASMDDYSRFSRGSSSNPANHSSNEGNRRRLPVCGCGSTMRFYISGSLQNPGRPYWKCIHWVKGDSCKLFVWDDELSEKHLTFRDATSSTETAGGVNSESHSCKGCIYAEKAIEAETKKNQILKAKLVYERETVKGLTTRIQWLQFLLFLSWVILVVYVAWKLRVP